MKAPTRASLSELVDLERYPIDDLDGTGARLVDSARTALREVGACDLAGFLRPEAAASSVAGALAAREHGYRTEQSHDVEFTDVDAESREADDPLRIRVRSAKEGIAYDHVPPGPVPPPDPSAPRPESASAHRRPR